MTKVMKRKAPLQQTKGENNLITMMTREQYNAALCSINGSVKRMWIHPSNWDP